MNTHKTQCPRCHTIYPMPNSKVGDNKARATCGKCKHSFFLNLYLIDATKSKQQSPPPKNSASKSDFITDGDDDLDIVLPKTPIRPKKTKKVAATEGMIFDEMESKDKDDSSIFDDSELDDFMNKNLDAPKPTIVSSSDKNTLQPSNDDEWLDTLLKDDKNSTIQDKPVNRPNDDLSDIIGTDFDRLIPKTKITHPIAAKSKESKVMTTTPQKRPKRSFGSMIGWSFACFLMLGLLVTQYVYFNRNAIAKNPTQLKALYSVCPICKLPDADISSFRISHTTQQGSADYSTNLIANISNIKNSDQLSPNLKINIYGASGVIGNLVLSPEEYLNAKRSVISANQNNRFMLTIDVPYNEVQSVVIEPFY